MYVIKLQNDVLCINQIYNRSCDYNKIIEQKNILYLIIIILEIISKCLQILVPD